MTNQLDASIGLKKETTYGTYATPNVFPEPVSDTLDVAITVTEGAGLRVGSRVARSARRRQSKFEPGGNIEVEAASSGLGVFLGAAFGAVTNTEIPVSTGVYQQVHTPKADDFLDSYTIQKGIPPLGGGATHAMSFLGAQCNAIEFKAAAGAHLMVTTEWIAKDVVTNEAYASPSYPASLDLFNFVDGRIFIGNAIAKATTTDLATPTGDPIGSVREASLRFQNNLDAEGFNLGGGGKRTRKAVVGLSEITGQLTIEYDSATLRNAWLSDAPLTLLLDFRLPDEIAAGIVPTLQLHVPAIHLEGELPKVNSSVPITQTFSFKGADSLAASTAPIYAVYRTTDTTP